MQDYSSQAAYIRELAKKLAELPDTQENISKRKRWADHNDLRSPQQPLIWVCPDDEMCIRDRITIPCTRIIPCRRFIR